MSNILTGFNMQGNDPIDNRIVSPSKFETLEEYLQRVPIQKRYYGLSFYALDENNELRHYTFQTSLIEPTIDDDEEEIERLDKELQEHVNNKEIHKTSEEIRSEIVDADIPDTIARVQWTLDKIEEAVNTVMGDIVDGASDEYNTLKKIQDKIVELRTEVESQLYGDDGGEILKTLEQALKFLNQYKDFIVDIPDNYVNKQDIVDNLNTDDPTKVLSARQGKVLSETLTNYFDSAMASIRAETNRATNAENRIEAKLDSEIDRSTAEDIRIQSELDAEEARAQSEEKRIEGKLDAEIERSTTKDTELGNQIIAETNRAEGEEQRIETKLDNEITRSTAKDDEHDDRIKALEGDTHVQNTDIGTTSQTFQLQMGKPGNKIKNEDAAVSVRNAADTDYVNFIAKNATFKGDLIVEGQSFVTEAETVEIKDNILLLNKGEAGSGVTKGMAGLQIDRGTEPDFQILFVESDRRFKAGEEGNLQCLALRDDDGNMLDGMFTTWDSATHRLKTTNIIPSTRKLFFNTNTNSLGFANHTYDSSYSAESFTFTTSAGSLFFSTGTSNLNLDTDKTYFRFYKNLFIPSSIISSETSISLLNNSGATIATFGSPSTINSSLNVANQVIIKGGSDTKLIMQSADADNFNLIESQNSSGTVLSKLGYYGTFWGIDNKKIATEEFANNKFLPLAGGTMTGVILMNNNVVIQSKNSSGTAKRLIGKGSDNVTSIGDTDGHTYLYSDAANIIHVRNGTNYTIYDSYNFNPGNYLPLTGGNLSGDLLLNNNINLQWKNPSGTATTQMYYNSNSVLVVGNLEDAGLHLRTSAVDLVHDKGGTTYRIWDASNLSTPLLYSGGTAATPTTAVGRNLGVNGSQWTFLSTINAATTSIYAPTTTGTSGQVLTSTGGVPTWNSLASIGDSRYVKKDGDTMTGNLSLPYLTSTQPVSGWTSKKVPNDYKPKSFYLEDDYNGGSGISNYGTVVTFSGRSAHWVSQMRFAGGDSTRLAVRTCDYNGESEALRKFTDWEILANQEYVDSKVKDYLPLSGGTMSGNISFNGNTGHIVVGAMETSNFVSSITYTKGSTENAAIMGYHSVGGSDGSGALVLVPYSTSANPWAKTVGLYIAKNELLLDGNVVVTQSWVTNQNYYKSGSSYPLFTSGVTLAANASSGGWARTYWVGNNASDGATGVAFGGYGEVDIPNYAYVGVGDNRTHNAVNNLKIYTDKVTFGNKTLATVDQIPTIPSISITTSGSGNVVTGISASGHTLTVTKGSASVSVSWNDITGKPSSFTPSAHTHEYIVGKYTGSGGVIAPGSIGTYKLQCNMMYTNAESSGGGYCDWILMNAYSWSDVPYATAIGVVKAATPSAYIMSGPNSTDKSTWVRKKLATTDEIPTRTSDLTNNSGFLTSSSLSGYATQSWVTSQGYLTSSSLSGYATQTYVTTQVNNLAANCITVTTGTNYIPVNLPSAIKTSEAAKKYLEWYDQEPGWYNFRMGYLYANGTITATGNVTAPTFVGALSGNATTATTATKLGSSTIGGTAKPIYLSSGTATACSATVGSSTVPVYMSSGTITQCSTTLGVSITGNAATATTASNSNNLGGYAAATYVKSTSTTKVQDIQVVTAEGSTTGVLYVVLES